MREAIVSGTRNTFLSHALAPPELIRVVRHVDLEVHSSREMSPRNNYLQLFHVGILLPMSGA